MTTVGLAFGVTVIVTGADVALSPPLSSATAANVCSPGPTLSQRLLNSVVVLELVNVVIARLPS
jgi:hypothetical protein